MDEKTKYRLVKSLINYIGYSDEEYILNHDEWDENQMLDYIAKQVMLMLNWLIFDKDISLNFDEVRSIARGEIHDEYWLEVSEMKTI